MMLCHFNTPLLPFFNPLDILDNWREFAVLDFVELNSMKSRNFPRPLLTIAAVTVACLFARDVMAQNGSSDAATISNAAQTAAPPGGAPVQLSYGVPQILQLSSAKIGDSTIVAYIQNSGTIYSLNASEIVYLKQRGVSDAVITTMLNQRQRVAQAVPPASAAVAAFPAGGAETSTAVAPPTVTYVQTVPSSSVYVIPDTQTYQYYNNYYPYYGCYPYYSGWYYPPVSFSFGFGGGHYGGWGGYRGYYHGGGWHR